MAIKINKIVLCNSGIAKSVGICYNVTTHFQPCVSSGEPAAATQASWRRNWISNSHFIRPPALVQQWRGQVTTAIDRSRPVLRPLDRRFSASAVDFCLFFSRANAKVKQKLDGGRQTFGGIYYYQ